MTKSEERTEREIILTCLHEIGHAITLVKQGYKLKSVSVDRSQKLTTGIAGQCVTAKPHVIMEFFAKFGISLDQFHNLELAAELKKVVAKNVGVRAQFLQFVEDGLAVAQSGFVAEVLLWGTFNDCGKMAISDATFVKLVSAAIESSFGQGQATDQCLLDEVAIEFMLAIHPGKGVMAKTIKRIMRELRDEKVNTIVKTMIPRLLSKGKLSRSDLRAIESAFQVT